MRYSKMTIEELGLANQKLMIARDKIKAKQLEINAIISQKQAEESLIRSVEAMSSEQKALAAQMIQAEGIESKESVGSLGKRIKKLLGMGG